MARGGGGGSGGDADMYKSATDAKDLLDIIGKDVYKEVKSESNGFKDELEGKLSLAKVSGVELAGTLDPCVLIKDKRENLIGARGHPCGNTTGKEDDSKRFSKERVAEYDEKKIRDTNKSKGGNNEGQCAPYRRLSLCNKNFQKINNYSSNAKHNLLLDVCMAAKYEGNSITLNYPKYEALYEGSVSTTCTMLARSFADIGDIIRGRDLFRGNNKEKTKREKLEDNLKRIFGDIYEELKNEKTLQARYKKDDDPDFLKLREYWWNINRETVWKALTCDEENKLSNASYFRGTCGDNEKSVTQARDKCRCPNTSDGKPNDQVPTYFDYVPQYLRWFEEWAEDFCRKKKKYVEIVKKYCLDEAKEKYCSLNGYDCTKTKPAIGRLRMGNQCTKCFFACYPYEKWIEKQKEQFDKQKQRYENVIKRKSSSSRQRRSARSISSDDNGYEKIFYEKLQSNGYGTVNKFLEKLSKENVCTKVDDKGGKIRFEKVNSGSASGDGGGASGTNVESQGTFYRSKYCQPCPDCGMKKKDGGSGKEWEPKKVDENCTRGKRYKPIDGKKGTEIKILKSGENHDDIKQKIEEFCKRENDESLYAAWKCYKHDEVQEVGEKDEEDDDEEDVQKVKNAGGLCILENKNKKEKNEPDEIQKTFNPFFYYWVAHMLKDSIYWETQKLEKCLKNGNPMKCRNGCHGKCDCFKRWIDKKKTEWTQIKEQFSKQDFGPQVENVGSGMFVEAFTSPDVVLQEVLKLEFENKNTEEDKENNVSAKEIDLINKMLKEDETTGADVAENEENTPIDKLLQHEEKKAQTCLGTHKKDKCDEPKPKAPDGGGGLGRADLGTEENIQTPGEDSSEEEEEDEEDDTEEVEEEDTKETEENVGAKESEASEENQGEGETTPQQEVEPPKEEVNPCEIVKELFTSGDNTALNEACPTKYGPKAPTSWKCVPTTSGGVTATGGSICVPPRRRRLYVKKLHDWASRGGNTQASETTQGGTSSQIVGKTASDSSDQTLSEGSAQTASHLPNSHPASPSNPRDGLRDAFIQSAAVETFFLWDRYKKEKEKPKEQQNGVGPFLLAEDDEEEKEKPQEQLEKGEIPEEFKRQMFYTLADYKDILDGKNIVVDLLSGSSGSDKEIAQREKTIKEKITSFFQNGNKEAAGVPNPQPPIQSREKWWNEHAKHIWHGMICALTYKEKDEKGAEGADGKTTLKQIQNADKLLKKIKDNGKEGEYHYSKVELKEQNGTEAKGPQDGLTPQTTHLSKFVLRPPYFRYLEEWGQNFCKERKKRLEKIKDDCYKDDEKQYSGDGEDCLDNLSEDANIFSDFGRSCADSCRLYKKWIDIKKIQYEKQKKEYSEQKDKAKNNNGLSERLKTSTTAAAFLKTLGPCSKTNSGEGPIKFDDQDETFKHTNLCDPCPVFGVKYNKQGWTNAEEITCNGRTINAQNIKDKYDSTVLDMHVSDKSATIFPSGLEACKDAGIFKGIRKDEWKCVNICGYDVCGLKIENKKNYDQIILINALLKRWLEYFFEDYNKIQKKVKAYMNSSDGCKCIKGCIEKWVQEKTKEWDKINATYIQEYTEKNPDGNTLTNFLEQFEHQTEFKNAIKPCKSLDQFKTSCGLNGDESSENGHKDAIDCMIKKLQNKIDDCNKNQAQTGGKNQAKCEKHSAPVGDDEEDLLLEETQENIDEAKKKMIPKICGDIPTTEEQTNTEETCEAVTPPKEKEDEEEKKEDGDPAEPAPLTPGPTTPKEPPPPSQPTTPKIVDKTPALVTSTLAWSVGIGFAAFTYFFLKKKTKSSVGNLFQILQIPKSDYGTPTPKSKNRYIPYVSDRYKGKTYIYMEGDSSGDEKYAFMSDTTDITSSESEYEELDINDIYVPGSPKYKTLIEVVLEPSGNNTTASGNNTTASGNNTTASGKNTPSDNTPTPQPIADNEWNTLKDDFISQYLQSEQPNDIPNDYKSRDIPFNTQPNTLYFDNNQEKPFITSIHDRDLYSGEEYNYNVNMSTNSMDDPKYVSNNVYSGIDLINDTLSGNKHIDIYDELLKRKENELFGTNHVKQTSIHSVAKLTNSDPIHNQLELFHKWLDRHRDMCEQWENHHERLAKLKEEWENETHSGDINSGIPSGKLSDTPSDNNIHSDIHPSDIPSGKQSDIPSDNNIHSDIPYVLNTDVSIQIHMDNPKPINQFTNMDTILEDLEKYNEPYYYDMYDDDIYYDVNDDHDTSTVDSNAMDVPSKVQIEMDVNTKLVKEKYPIADVWDI